MQTPLVILHGGMGIAADLSPMLVDLAPGRMILTPNMIGHAGRDVPDVFTLQAIAEDLLAQCDASGVKDAHWLGHSFGGLVAIWIATHYPDRVRSLVTLGTKFSYDEQGIRHVVHLHDPARLGAPDYQRRDQLSKHGPTNWLPLAHAYRALYASFGETPPFTDEQLARVAAPTLIMTGTGDPVAPPHEASRVTRHVRLARHIPYPNSLHPIDALPLDAIKKDLNAFFDDPSTVAERKKVDFLKFKPGGS